MTTNVAGSQGSKDEDLKHPLFQSVVEEVQRYGVPVVAQRGVYGNKQGQIFSIDVVGREEDSVRVYTDEVRVRLTHEFIDAPKETESGRPDIDADQADKLDSPVANDLQRMLDLRSNLLGDNPRTLVIMIDFVGVSPMWNDTPTETKQKFINSVSAEALHDVLQKEFKLATPSQLQDTLRQAHYSQDYAIDFIIDPKIGDGAAHDYPVECAKSARVTLDISRGGGSVVANLTRNGRQVLGFPLQVTKGHRETQENTASSKERGSYDLLVSDPTKVRGGSTYQVSGLWVRTYSDDPPKGGGTTCRAR